MIVSLNDTARGNYSSVISTADLKAHLRVTHSDEDTLIEVYRAAACEFVEAYCNTRIVSGTINFNASGFASIIELPIAPVIRVNSITYKTSKDGATQTLASSQYYVEKNRKPAVLKFITAPSVDSEDPAPVVINADVGHTTAPESLVQAVRFMVGHFYENRQAAEAASVKEIPLGIFSLLNPYRVISFR
tara:strand:- start:68 stop:634 length:567 start_codon:yes stop_codon:yes gene_type:complete